MNYGFLLVHLQESVNIRHTEISDFFNDRVTSYSMLPPYVDTLCRENPETMVVWHFKDIQH